MISFVETLKRNLNDEQNRLGMRNRCCVDSHALRDLINAYERIDSADRCRGSARHSLYMQLHYVIEALYRNGDDSGDALMLKIMMTMQPLIESRDRERGIDARFNRS